MEVDRAGQKVGKAKRGEVRSSEGKARPAVREKGAALRRLCSGCSFNILNDNDDTACVAHVLVCVCVCVFALYTHGFG